MRRPHASTLAAVLVLTALGVGPAPSAGAAEDVLRVPTAYLTHDEHAVQGAGTPGDLLADVQESGVMDLVERPPAGTGAVPPGLLRYGTIVLGGRRILVALGEPKGDTAVTAVDLDGDGNLRGPAEVVSATGRAGRTGGRMSLRWKLPTQTLGSLKLDLSFRQLAHTFNAVLVTASPQPLELSEAAPAGCRPLTVAGHVRYATVDTPQGVRAVAFVRGEGERLTLLLDRDGNGTLGEAGEMVAAPVQAREPGATFWQTAEVDLGGAAVGFAYQELAPQAQVGWSARVVGSRRGTVTLDGETWTLHLLDADFDGTYGSSGDFWWFGPATWLQRFTQLLPVSMVETSQPFPHQPPWRLVSVDAQGGAVLTRDRSAPDPDAYFHARTERVNETRWFPAFEHDTGFVERWRVDTTRPKAATPPRWHHATSVAAALARAQAAGKPLLVDFEADWCSICKRWDYHVYGDREVAELLSRFVLVKINVDFNFARDVERLEGKNPPYLVFLGTDGKPLLEFPEVDAHMKPTGRSLPGLAYFQRPADFAQTLRAALAACR